MPNYTYTLGRPAGNITPAAQRPDMQINNDSAASIWTVDHYGFNDNNGGYHQKSTYVAQGVNPGSSAAQLVEFAKTVAGSSELFLQRDGVSTAIQLTSGLANTGANTAKSVNNGQSFIPGPFLIKFGTSSESALNRTIIFTTDANLTAFPNNCFGVWVSPLTTVDLAFVTAVSTTQFSIRTTASVLTTFWVAIGN